MRFAGPLNNFKADSITIYQEEWFQSFQYYADVSSNTAAYGGSLIVTGTSAWTLYEYCYSFYFCKHFRYKVTFSHCNEDRQITPAFMFAFLRQI